jgi:ethanolamine utilization protein EutA
MGEKETILSVGIDIGTSTTQVVFSQLTFENSASYFMVPHISIVDKKVIYKSDIYMTPLKTSALIDGERVRDIVATEFSKAGYKQKDTQTGAVIITGESARKENSEIVLKNLSDFAGEFVVSTAGPDLEAIIAGMGSGARQYSIENQCTVVNLDIGGGTTNVVLFDKGEILSKGCVDIGGRLIKYKDNYDIEYISRSALKVAKDKGIDIREGSKADYPVLHQITDGMAELLERLLGIGDHNQLLEEVITPASSSFSIEKPIDAVCFSGGVADCIYNPSEVNWTKYGDIGVLLGDSIRNSRLFTDFKVIKALETIRATVVGAGTYTVSVSGSTINYSRDVFPLKNVPALKLSDKEQEYCFMGKEEWLTGKVNWMLEQNSCDQLILAMKGKNNPSYMEVKALAECLARVMNRILKPGIPIIIVLECDMAKALGQLMTESLKNESRDVICIDSIRVDHNYYVDMGKPLINGMVIPVVIKTLIFG